MSALQKHQINACKFDYEYLGKTISELAGTYDFREQDIASEIELNSWVRKIQPTTLPNTSDLTEFATALEATTRAKLSVIALFRQIDQQPLIAELEKTLLNKAILLATSLDSDDDKAATKLMNIVKAAAALQDRNPINLADEVKKQLGSAGTVVQIANHIN